MTVHERPDRLHKRPDPPNGGDGGDRLPPDAGERDVPRDCPDAERLAEYADGLLDAAARAAIEAHLVTCADCRFAVVETMAFLGGAEAAPAVGDTIGEAAGDTPGEIPGDTESVTPAAIVTPLVSASPVGAAPVTAASDVTPLADAAATAGDTSATSTTSPVRVVPFRRRYWVTGVGAGLAAAAALVLIVRLAEIQWFPEWLGGQPVGELIAALDHQRVRPVEGRLMMGLGGPAYKPAPSPTRGGNDRLGRDWSPDVEMATARIEQFAEGSTSARRRATLGVALIVEGDLDRAIAELEEAVKELRYDPVAFNNLSAAYLARARWWNRPEDWQKALDAAIHALETEGNTNEAHFNVALALEGLGETDRAAKAWADYARRDPDSGWGREAEERRKALLAHQP